MPWSAVHTYTDPGDYAAAIRATTIDLTVMRCGHFIGKRTRIDLLARVVARAGDLREHLQNSLQFVFVQRHQTGFNGHRAVACLAWPLPPNFRARVAPACGRTTRAAVRLSACYTGAFEHTRARSAQTASAAA